ncbi:MAG: 2-oxoacid:acceptor oxidoreductase subunit alpha [Candidatus Omnitrophica bacterium]|nr:2-oxoacid:acceptor oxidoreductase subunit alpha [Candidatus Omnitrophota bacterium]
MKQTMGSEAKKKEKLNRVTLRFAGDSGDGMQLTGERFTDTSALFGNDISTVPDFPAEIRAPAGTLPGVSAFQLTFSDEKIYTPGDAPDVLVAMNPAALRTNLRDLAKGKVVIANTDSFTDDNLRKAGWKGNPLEDGTLKDYRVFTVPITQLTRAALKDLALKQVEGDRTKNFFALGLVFWLYDRPMDSTLTWIAQKFSKRPEIAEANVRTLKAGYHFGETTEIFHTQYEVEKAVLEPGLYRKVSGNEATVLGLVAISELANTPLLYASYPITPASDILHGLAQHKNFRVKTFQAEDEIAACGAALGASFGGQLGITGTSGPGLCLKSEMINLAVMTELPLVVLDVQRGGPSTGLPTKTEQADLLMALAGRNSESPLAIVAPQSPADCFFMVIEAVRIAVQFMTPVIFLSDGYLANSSEPWRIPDIKDLPRLEVRYWTKKEGFFPYLRDPKTLARPWAVPGTPGLEHRIGGIEKAETTGNVSYDPDNHDRMTRLRAEKIARVADTIPPLEVYGDSKGDLLVLGWGSTYGAIRSAVDQVRKRGRRVSSSHLRYLNPFPKNLGEVIKGFKRVLIPEGNLGQLRMMIRSAFLVDAVGLNRVKGQPFKIADIEQGIEEMLK